MKQGLGCERPAKLAGCNEDQTQWEGVVFVLVAIS
jgi:hypothetical protein